MKIKFYSMKNKVLFFGIFLIVDYSNAQVNAISKIIHGVETASEAANTARAAKAGTKVVATEGSVNTLSETEKSINAETKALIASRAAQIINNCMATNTSKNKSSMCNKRSEDFHRCVSADLERTNLTNATIERCTKIHN
jgi:hypothetical protein